MRAIYDKLIEGGPFFMFPILFLLILILVLIVKGLIDKNGKEKMIRLISSIGWFTLVWGILGQTIGLIMAFDAIQAAGDVSVGIIAGGLKVSFLTTVFGFFTFLTARLGVIVLIWLQKDTVRQT
jgi:hypothetical protein